MSEKVTLRDAVEAVGIPMIELPPKPGKYTLLPPALYHALGEEYVSASRLKKLRRSPMHCKYSMDFPPEPSEAMRLGAATHMAILEPELFDDTYASLPHDYDGRKKESKAIMAQLQEDYDQDCILKAPAYGQVMNMAQAVDYHPTAGPLLESCPEREITLIWKESDLAENLLLKARLDAVSPVAEAVIDIKTTTDASPESFSRDIFRLGYHIQAAMYLRGARSCGGYDAAHFILIAVEKTAPYAVGVYRLTNEAIEQGWREAEKLIKLYGECLAANNWPGYVTDAAIDIDLPKWAKEESNA